MIEHEPYYERGARRDRALRSRLRRPDAGAAQGPDRMRQDPLRRVHGVAARRSERCRPHHGRLPRGSHRQRPGRPLPDHKATRRSGSTGRSRRPCARAPSAISTRSSRRARTRPSSSIRSPTTAASCRSTRRGEILEAHPEFLLVHLLQPRLPERAEGPEAHHPAALRRDRVRLSRTATGSENRRGRKRCRHRDGGKLVQLAHMTRNLKGSGLDEGASTRLLVHAAKLMRRGIAPRAACPARSPRRSRTTPRCCARCMSSPPPSSDPPPIGPANGLPHAEGHRIGARSAARSGALVAPHSPAACAGHRDAATWRAGLRAALGDGDRAHQHRARVPVRRCGAARAPGARCCGGRSVDHRSDGHVRPRGPASRDRSPARPGEIHAHCARCCHGRIRRCGAGAAAFHTRACGQAGAPRYRASQLHRYRNPVPPAAHRPHRHGRRKLLPL